MKPIISTTQRTPFRSTQTGTPIDPDRDGRSVRVDVRLGSLTERMLIDTGATGLRITESVAGPTAPPPRGCRG